MHHDVSTVQESKGHLAVTKTESLTRSRKILLSHECNLNDDLALSLTMTSRSVNHTYINVTRERGALASPSIAYQLSTCS